jgi:tetratricopeptide (TPR) repeat protein
VFPEVVVNRDELRQEAMELVGKAYQHHMKGELGKAIKLYDQSIAAFPTAEAYTFRGWARSCEPVPALQEAIADCQRAIDLDPEFGNPYNDIGAYYIELDQLDDAVPWLKMALRAKRYESYCFPYFNLGRVCEIEGRLEMALEYYRAALKENAGYAQAARAIERIEARLGSPEHSRPDEA